MPNPASHNHSPDLVAVARQSMIEAGFAPDLNEAVAEQVRSIATTDAHPHDSSVRDLRNLLWSSIDDKKSRDLDQVEYAEHLPSGDIKLLIGIADVDEFVSKDSAIDNHAAENCTSVYAGVKTFPMLPEELSTDLTSMNAGQTRFSLVTEIVMGAGGGVKNTAFYRAIVINHAKLSYDSVGAWLDGKSGPPTGVAAVPGLDDQIRLQFEISKRLSQIRREQGTIELGTIQATPVVNDSGQVTELAVVEQNSARDLIANFMIAANVAMARFLESNSGPSLRRVVRTPKYWPRIVEIAADLGEQLPETPNSRALADSF